MALVLGIVAVAFLLLVTERLRMDVVALLVLGSLALTGLVDSKQALSGFSSPAVVTVWAVFILSGGLKPSEMRFGCVVEGGQIFAEMKPICRPSTTLTATRFITLRMNGGGTHRYAVRYAQDEWRRHSPQRGLLRSG